MRPGGSRRILIVGAGSIGLKHLRAFKEALPELALTAIDPKPEARAKARELGAETIDCNWESADLSEYDGVVICAPPPQHVPYSTRCLKEGIPVLSEKPLSNSMDGVSELVGLSEQPGAPASGVAYVRRYIPVHEHVRKMLESGELGPIPVARITAGQPFTTYRPDYKTIYYASRAQGGGCVLDFASHFVDLVQYYLGPVESMKGYAARLSLEGVEVEDTTTLSFRFANGALGCIHINQYQPLNENLIDLCGPEACLRITEPGFTCRLWRKGAGEWEDVPVEQGDYMEGLRNQARAFLAAIDGKEPLKTSFADAAHTLQLCLDVLKDPHPRLLSSE